MIRLSLVLFVFGLDACYGDETISAYADPDTVYVLEEMNGTSFDASATIAFPSKGRAEGDGPCNRWSAKQSAPYPWFALADITATKAACPNLPKETAFLQALELARFAEVQGPVLILSDEDGQELVFRAVQPGRDIRSTKR